MNGKGRMHVMDNPTPHRSKCRCCGQLITEPYRIKVSGKDLAYYYHIECVRVTVDVADRLMSEYT